jgi:hypothetical protein
VGEARSKKEPRSPAATPHSGEISTTNIFSSYRHDDRRVSFEGCRQPAGTRGEEGRAATIHAGRMSIRMETALGGSTDDLSRSQVFGDPIAVLWAFSKKMGSLRSALRRGDLSPFEFFYVWKNFRRHAPIAPRTPVPRRTRLDGSGTGATGGGTGSTGLSVMVIVILLKN